MSLRCAEDSLARDEPLTGTASTVRAFLLVESPGAWGVDAVRGSRLPAEVRRWLARLPAQAGVRPLMIRRHRRRGSDPAGPLRVFAGHAHARRPWLQTTLLDDPRELLDLDVAALGQGASPGLTVHEQPVFGVCTHGRHDACCAERGRPLCRALSHAAPEHTWEVSHIGGDRFAPNLLVLPWGLYYGRLEPQDAPGFAAAHLRGELDLPHLRGRCAFPFAVQAAEAYLRAHTGVLGVDAVRLLSAERDGARTRVGLGLGAERWQVVVHTEKAAPRQLTCRASAWSASPQHSLVSLDRI